MITYFIFLIYMNEVQKRIQTSQNRSVSNSASFSEDEIRRISQALSGPQAFTKYRSSSPHDTAETITESESARVNESLVQSYHKLLDDYITKISRFQNTIPAKDKIFSMFDMLDFENIKVVIIGQDPYPGKCKITNENYACGPAFAISEKVKSCPTSLQNLFTELKSSYRLPGKVKLDYIKNTIQYWINQGVFLTNTSLTIGTTGTYLDNHRMFWMNFSISFVQYVSKLNCPIVLLGKEAWEFSKFTESTLVNDNILKFPHPAARDDSFKNCGLFIKINNWLIDHQQQPIKWVIDNSTI
jgi:uracil-DNA glycosylase